MDRMLRVNELLKRELGIVFEQQVRGRVHGLVTVTDVKTAPDLRTAVVYVSMYGSDDEKGKLMHLLHRERSDIQKQMMRNIRLKYTPVLDFRLDEHLGEADRILQLLDELEQGDADDTSTGPAS